MERKTSKKAIQVADMIKEQYGYDRNIVIYFGAPDARFKRCWWAFANVIDGIHISGHYGQPLRTADTLSNLAIKGKYESPGCGAI